MKQILHKAKEEKLDKLVNNTAGVVCINASYFSGFLLNFIFFYFLELCLSELGP